MRSAELMAAALAPQRIPLAMLPAALVQGSARAGVGSGGALPLDLAGAAQAARAHGRDEAASGATGQWRGSMIGQLENPLAGLVWRHGQRWPHFLFPGRF